MAVSVKLLVADIRLLEKAKTEPELRGCVDLMLSRIEQAKVAKEFAPKKLASESTHFSARSFIELFKELMGDKVTIPPFPEPNYFISINKHLKAWGMNEVYARELAAKCLATLKPPYQLSWIVYNHDRIMRDGITNQVGHKKLAAGTAWHGAPTFLADKLPGPDA